MGLIKQIIPAHDGPQAPPAPGRADLGREGRLLWEQRLTNRILWQLLTPEQQGEVRRQVAGEG